MRRSCFVLVVSIMLLLGASSCGGEPAANHLFLCCAARADMALA